MQTGYYLLWLKLFWKKLSYMRNSSWIIVIKAPILWVRSFNRSLPGWLVLWHFCGLACLCVLSHVWLFAILRTVACQASLSMWVFFFQARILEWVAIPPSGTLPDPGIKRASLSLWKDSLPAEPLKQPLYCTYHPQYSGLLECASGAIKTQLVTFIEIL